MTPNVHLWHPAPMRNQTVLALTLLAALAAGCGDDRAGLSADLSDTVALGGDTGDSDADAADAGLADADAPDVVGPDSAGDVVTVDADGDVRGDDGDAGAEDTAAVPDATEPDGVDTLSDTEAPGDTAAPADTAAPWTAPAPVGCLTDVSAGHHVFSCDGGLFYDVEIPAACTAAPCGLILDIHGWTMSAGIEDANTDMRARGRDHGYVVVQPTAALFVGVPTWNLDNDAPRVFAFIADAAAALRTDPRRAHVMGFSQGGGMTWRLLCTHPEFFASAAPIGAITGCDFSGDQAPAQEVDVLDVHGRSDAVVNYDQMGRPQVDAAVAYWPFGAPVTVEEDADHTVLRWLTPSGTVLEHWAHDYEASSLLLRGHCFPGSPQQLAFPVAFGCADANTFDYAALALAFFEAHPAP